MIKLTINGTAQQLDVDPDMPLLWALRDHAGLTGSKYGCGMAFGLAAALDSELTLEQGRVVQSNFHDYRVLRMDRMSDVEVHIVQSAQPPTGVGEPATPVIAPAVANALSAATGHWFDRLPLRLPA